MSYGYRGRPQFGFGPRGRPPMMGGPPRGPPRFRGQGFGNMRMQNQWNWSTGNDFHNDWDGGGGPCEDEGPPPMHRVSPDNVKDWLSRQHPNVIRDIMMHSKWLLEKMGFSGSEPIPDGPASGAGGDFATDEVSSDMSSWYAPFKPTFQSNDGPGGGFPMGPPAKRGKRGHAGLGYSPGQTPSSQMQWTPEGWVAKDNSHKVTTMMRPLPKVQIVPPLSVTYPDASTDNDKLKMLENNVNMMTIELNKICKRFNISNLNRDDLSQYPEMEQGKLKTALTCVSNAEKTFENFKEFLKTEKYKEWNEEQDDKRAEQVRQMIGQTPDGVPHKRPSAAANEEQEEEEEEDDAGEDPSNATTD